MVEQLFNNEKPKEGRLVKYRRIIEGVLGLEVSPLTSEEFRLIQEFTAVRNLVAHNNRYVDREFLNSTPWLIDTLSCGERLMIGHCKLTTYINAVFRYVDSTVVEAFLPQIEGLHRSIKGFSFNSLAQYSPSDEREVQAVIKTHNEELTALTKRSSKN